jgi:DNA-binding MarR family transcriptional regulator
LRRKGSVATSASSKQKRRDASAVTARGLRLDLQHPWRHENIGRLLLTGVINWQDILVRGLQQRGFPRFRASHMNVLRHIDLGGTRITEIAERSRLSKQAVGQLLTTCEAEKLVKTVPDPHDRRAKIVRFTGLGRAVIDVERDVMKRIDADLAELLGARGLAALRRSLALLGEWTGPFTVGKKPRSGRRRTSPG